ncbi:SDR family oxidoreductase [Rhizobium paknamense]|uniref:NAD(P)-dependent dehydrogenase (Short-subunit alcohol dehydrogenase family) n=1 Tax=Rhizobium paknamense TaxID=1206817 RepID=A0ABU0IJ27_9HYPH|nr:SDR family oxidoreductase [Rhizobium paknamense]MDQ0458232.1 NAD(P)-dependent dehydrogenase (short-subunit alcohol dehydrogenase family) [Rhizobium paknamense]
MSTKSKVWFITGTSRGFGRIWAEAALLRGDRVAATARNIETLTPLVDQYGDRVLPLALDVTDRASAKSAIDAAVAHFGRLDVVVNNAGYGLFGMVEEVSEPEARDQFETNFFGALWVTQAALPHLRAQGSGHIIQVSSIGGVTAFPFFGIYNASKWALEGMSQALAAEVMDFSIKVTLVEPMPYATDWSGPSARKAEAISDYDHVRAGILQMFGKMPSGDPQDSVLSLLKLVDADNPPLRVFFGRGALEVIEAEYFSRISDWKRS